MSLEPDKLCSVLEPKPVSISFGDLMSLERAAPKSAIAGIRKVSISFGDLMSLELGSTGGWWDTTPRFQSPLEI